MFSIFSGASKTTALTTLSTTAVSTTVMNQVTELTTRATMAKVVPENWFSVKKSELEVEDVLFDVVAKSKMHCVFVCKSYQGCRVASYDTVSGSCVGKAEEMDGDSETTPTLFIVN